MTQTSETIRKDNRQKAQLEEDEVTARAKAAFKEIRAIISPKSGFITKHLYI